jgi:hypothetical protein
MESTPFSDRGQPSAEPSPDAPTGQDLPDPTPEASLAPDAAGVAGLDAAHIQVVYTDTLPEGVFVVYRSNPARLLINEAWWRVARPVERIQALEHLWARLQAIPPEASDDADSP